MQNKIPTTRPSISLWAAFVFLAVVVAFSAALMTGCGARDDSDMPDGRLSGVRVRTDALTGCQYLEAVNGGITPRMDRNGKQVCK